MGTSFGSQVVICEAEAVVTPRWQAIAVPIPGKNLHPGVRWLERALAHELGAESNDKSTEYAASPATMRIEDPEGTIWLPATAGSAARYGLWTGEVRIGDVITWWCRASRSGRFRIVIVAGGDRDDFWKGGCTVELATAARVCTGELIFREELPGRPWSHYPAAKCYFGEIDLVAGPQEISLSVRRTVGQDPSCILWLQLERLF